MDATEHVVAPGMRFVLKLYLAHCKMSRHWQRLKYHTTSLASPRTATDLIIDKISMLPRAILPTRLETTFDTTIASAFVILHLEVRPKVSSSVFMIWQTMLER
jgi:hypothetical protein